MSDYDIFSLRKMTSQAFFNFYIAFLIRRRKVQYESNNGEIRSGNLPTFFFWRKNNESKKDIMGISFGIDDRVDVFHDRIG